MSNDITTPSYKLVCVKVKPIEHSLTVQLIVGNRYDASHCDCNDYFIPNYGWFSISCFKTYEDYIDDQINKIL